METRLGGDLTNICINTMTWLDDRVNQQNSYGSIEFRSESDLKDG